MWEALSSTFLDYYILENGVFREITETEQFFGDIYQQKNFESYLYTVAGVVKTGFQEEFLQQSGSNTLAEAKNSYLLKTFLKYFCTENYLRTAEAENFYNIVNLGESIVQYDSISVTNTYSYKKLKESNGINASVLIYQDGTMWMNDIFGSGISVEEKECIISLPLYNQLLGSNYRASDFCDILDYVNIPKAMPALGQKIKVQIEGDNNKSVVYEELEVVGIVFRPLLVGNDSSLDDIYLSDSSIDNFAVSFELKTNALIGIVKDYEQLSQYFETNSNIIVKSVYAEELYIYQDSLAYTRNILFILSMVLLAITIFLLYYYLNSHIGQEKRSIGIYRSLGATRGNIISIYLLEGFLIAMLIAIIATAGTLILMPIINAQMAKSVLEGALLFSISPLMITELLLTSFVTTMLAVLIPTIRLGRMKPIDVIKMNY